MSHAFKLARLLLARCAQPARVLALIVFRYTVAVYLYFVGMLVYAAGFFAGLSVPEGIDRGERMAVPAAAATARLGVRPRGPSAAAADHSGERAVRRAQIALRAARSNRTGDRLRRVAALLRRMPKTRGSYHDPLFERPDLVEDDYYRFRNQPAGYR